MAQARTLALSGGKNEGFALLVVVPAVCRHAGGNVFHSPYWFFRLAQPYLKPPRTNRDGSCAGLRVDLRHRALFRVQQTARIDCHCTDRACRKQVFHVGYRVDRRRQFWAVGVFDAVGGCVFVIPVTLVFRRPFPFRRPYLVIMSSEIFYKAKSWQTKDSSTASTPSTPPVAKPEIYYRTLRPRRQKRCPHARRVGESGKRKRARTLCHRWRAGNRYRPERRRSLHLRPAHFGSG